MNVLVLTPWWPTRDRPWFGTFVRYQSRALAEAGADVDVLLAMPFYATPRRMTLEGGVARVVRLPLLPRYVASEWCWPMAARALSRSIDGRYDLVIVHTEVVAAIFSGVASLPYRVIVHGTNTDERPTRGTRRRRMLCDALSSSESVVAVGRSLVPWIRERYEFDGRIDVVENGFDPVVENIDVKPILCGEHITISCVGALDPDKGQRVLVEAARALAGEGQTLRLELVGDGPDRHTLLERGRGCDCLTVRLHGWCAPDLASRIIAESDIFVLPSRREAVGIVYLNAMALGRPVVGVRGQGIDGIVVHGETGFLSAPGDPSDLARILREIIAAPDNARMVAERGRQLARSAFSWQRNAERLLALATKAATT